MRKKSSNVGDIAMMKADIQGRQGFLLSRSHTIKKDVEQKMIDEKNKEKEWKRTDKIVREDKHVLVKLGIKTS